MIEQFRGKPRSAKGCVWEYSDHLQKSEFFARVESGMIDPATVGQWTGAKDSEQVDIYRHDIVSDGIREMVVEWDNDNFCWALYMPERWQYKVGDDPSHPTEWLITDLSYFFSDLTERRLKVIGTIHDKR